MRNRSTYLGHYNLKLTLTNHAHKFFINTLIKVQMFYEIISLDKMTRIKLL